MGKARAEPGDGDLQRRADQQVRPGTEQPSLRAAQPRRSPTCDRQAHAPNQLALKREEPAHSLSPEQHSVSGDASRLEWIGACVASPRMGWQHELALVDHSRRWRAVVRPQRPAWPSDDLWLGRRSRSDNVLETLTRSFVTGRVESRKHW